MALCKEDYVARIAQASGVQLTIITYELAIHYIEEAKALASHPGEKEAYGQAVNKARAAVESLMDTLDMAVTFSRELMPLYIYINKRLAEVYFNQNMALLDEAQTLLQTLLEGWQEVEKSQADAAPLMDSAQQLYAGLTYKNGRLQEYIQEDDSRGFQA